MTWPPQPALLGALLLAGCAGSDGPIYRSTDGEQPGVAAVTTQRAQALPEVQLELLSTAVPWPRGIAWVDGKLAVLARGRHRSYGGPAPDFEDQAATIFEIDPSIAEPYVPGEPASERVAANGRVLAAPDPSVVHEYDRTKAPLDDWLMNRPYCTMVFDEPSRNLVFCAYSGVDLSGKDGGPTFRKNATDALYRYDLRTARWGVVEKHDHEVVPRKAHGPWISNEHYPHHDPDEHAPPHGLLNGPNGCHVVGRYLYAVGKDNHTLAQYDMEPIRRDPAAGPPPARAVLGEHIDVEVRGERQRLNIKGHSAVTSHGGWLYLASRTSSTVIRFPIDAQGDLLRPILGELVAEFQPYTQAKGSAELWEMIANERGEILVSGSKQGRVWRFTPDPAVPFDGDDSREGSPTPNEPFIDIRALTGNPKATVSNMTYAPDGSLYLCVTMPEPDREMAGMVLRVLEERRG